MKFTLLITLILILSSCFKTAEEIKREQQIDQQMSQSSKIIADLSNQVSELKGGLANTSGQIEELGYHSKQSTDTQTSSFNQSITQLSEQVRILMSENEKMKSELTSLSNEFQSQKRFIQKVTGTLSEMTGKKNGPSQTNSSVKDADEAFEKNQKEKAKKLYLIVLDENKISASKRNHVFYNLGLLEYWNKKYDEALVYFSKIYTKYPKSSFAPRALLYIGLSFKNSNRLEEAKATFQELIKNYPKSKQAESAKKEI